MAWNRPNNEKVVKRDGGVQRNVHLRGLFAGMIIVVVGVAVLLYFILNSSRQPPAGAHQTQTAKLIKEVRPTIATNQTPTATNAPVKPRKPRKTYVDEKGVLRYEGGMVVRKPPVRTIKVGDHTPSIFKHVAEMQIAGILQIEPGTMVVGTMDYGKSFTDSLKESFKDKIVINPEDDEQTRQLKQDVIDVKAELRDRMAKGEDVGKLMSDSRADLQRLGMYKMELENEVRKILNDKAENDELTEQDIKDCYGAANTMLESKGLPRLNMSSRMLIRSLRRSAQEAKRLRELQQK